MRSLWKTILLLSFRAEIKAVSLRPETYVPSTIQWFPTQGDHYHHTALFMNHQFLSPVSILWNHSMWQKGLGNFFFLICNHVCLPPHEPCSDKYDECACRYSLSIIEKCVWGTCRKFLCQRIFHKRKM